MALYNSIRIFMYLESDELVCRYVHVCVCLQWSQMNASVTLDESGAVLRLTLGRMLTAELRRYDCAHDAFDAVIGGRLWWVSEGVPHRALLSVRFLSTQPGARPDVLELPLEMDPDAVVIRRSRFTRPGLTLAEDWEPAGPSVHGNHTCSDAASSVGPPHVWMLLLLLPVICRLFTHWH